MGLFNFGKKKDKVKNVDSITSKIIPDSKPNNIIGLEQKDTGNVSKEDIVKTSSTNKITNEIIEIKSIDCSYDPKTKCFTYITDIIPEIPDGFIGKLTPLDNINKKNYFISENDSIIYDTVNPINVKFTSTKSRFSKEPYNVGEVIATYSIINIKSNN